MSSNSSIEIVPLLSEHRQNVINLLLGSFFLQEPLNDKLKFDMPHEVLSCTHHIVDQALHDQCSFVAIDTTTPYKDVVGVVINGISDRSQLPVSSQLESDKLKFIFSIIDQVCDGHDLYQLYETDRVFHFDIINIDERLRGKSLSTRLIDASLDKAQEMGVNGASVVCTSLFSRKAFEKQGFQIINEILYSQCGNGRLGDMGIHDRCTLLGRKL